MQKIENEQKKVVSGRVLKFRAWDKNTKTMYSHGTLEDIVTNAFDYDVNYDDFEWLQYTGLQDKNGKDIYEGDVLRFNVAEGGIGEPAYRNKLGVAEITPYATRIGGFEAFYCAREEREVIGNVHANPELLS